LTGQDRWIRIGPRFGIALTLGGAVIELTHTVDYIYMLLITAGVGAIGGLGAELVLSRSEGTGMLALPRALKGSELVSLGFPASLIVGAIAAVAALYFFPPLAEKVIASPKGSAPKVVSEYDLVKLVPLAMIVGSAGPAFLKAAQSRLLSALSAQKAEATADTAKAQVDQIAASAKAEVASAVQSAVSLHMPTAAPAFAQKVAATASSSVEAALEPQVEGAHRQVDAIATGSPQPGTQAPEPAAQGG